MDGSAPIIFIVRASVKDGLGHLVRSLCVLRELSLLNPVKLLVLGDRSGVHLIDEAGIPWRQCATDGEAVSQALEAQPKVIVFDTLDFDPTAFDQVPKDLVKVSLSPVFSRMAQMDHLFHRTQIEPPAWAGQNPFPQIHKGFEFAILPPWLKRISTEHYQEQLAEDRLAVAISMGGTDAPNRTLQLLKLFGQSRSRLVLYVALGDAYTHSFGELLACAAENRQEVILLKSNESMWRVLKNVSLVLCAGGLTTYEAAFIGLPAINILQQADWAYLFEELAQAGACHTIVPSPDHLPQAVDLVMKLAHDHRILTQMHLATNGLIPDGGSNRIARLLSAFNSSQS